MSPKRIIVRNISCMRGTNNVDSPAGFQVSGHKEASSDQKTSKVGFIVSGIKIIAFQQAAGMGIRLRVKWIPNGFEIREEIHPLNGVVVDLQQQNNVLFIGEDDSVVVMQGEPNLSKNGFTGQLIDIKWQENTIKITPLQKQLRFHCSLISRNKRIDCLVK